jgi:hypothetical protein
LTTIACRTEHFLQDDAPPPVDGEDLAAHERRDEQKVNRLGNIGHVPDSL